MDVRILTWTTAVITGLLVTATVPVLTQDTEGGATTPSQPNLSNFNPNATTRLRQHPIYAQYITLSGFSSGGTFAQQLQISHSSLFSGIATFSHAYYRCGPGNGTEVDYDNACTIINPSANATWNPDKALADIRQYEQQGLIENTRNLRNKRLYVYAGTRSGFFDLDLSLAVVRVYGPLIQNPYAMRVRVQDAAQVMPTKNYGVQCTDSAESTYFLANCGFSGAHEALQFLLGDHIRNPHEGFRANPMGLMSFDQTEFFYGFEGTEHLMDTVGYIYVPRQCYSRPCFLHFYFHGCLTGRNFNGTGANHFINSGYMEVAELNDIIVVAPQAVGNQINEIECWDTYGLTGRQYATQKGAQVTIVRNMIRRIMGEDNRISVMSSYLSPPSPGSLFSASWSDKGYESRRQNERRGGYQ